jgi:glycosyltransferase involved in cell wall biosynthesis
LKRVVFCHNTAQYIFMHYQELAKSVVDAQCELICVVPKDDYCNELEKLGAKVVDWSLSQHGQNPIREIESILKLNRILAKLNPDLILSFSIKPNLYISLLNSISNRYKQFCMITGLGYVFIGTGFGKSLFRRLIVLLYRAGFRNVTGVFFQNDEDERVFQLERIVRQNQSRVIPGTGIDLTWIKPEVSIGSKMPLKFLYVGRLLIDKGVRELVNAARALKGEAVSFSLLGPIDSNPQGLSKDWIDQLEKEGLVKYLGIEEDVRPVLQQHDIFVLPSYREGLSRSIMEAMAAGMPVITTDVPGCRDLVEDGVEGFVVPPKDSDAICIAALKFIKNPELIASMGESSRRRVERDFDVHKVNKLVLSRMGITSAS